MVKSSFTREIYAQNTKNTPFYSEFYALQDDIAFVS